MTTIKNTFMVSAMKSGSGKTLVTLAIIKLLKQSGRSVSVFKTGPDYIDTMYHKTIAESPSVNLDPYFLEPEVKPDALKRLFYSNAVNDSIIIEGAMGFFDGICGEGKRGSACAVSEELGVDVILVADISEFDEIEPYLQRFPNRVRSVILNKLTHGTDIVSYKNRLSHIGLSLLGWLYLNENFHIESRHLGLEQPDKKIYAVIDKASSELKDSIDMDILSGFKASIPCNYPVQPLFNKLYEKEKKYKIAYASDKAFSFTYPENIRVLEEFGFEIAPFSPIADSMLPENSDVVWFAGGYPELYAKELENNISMLRSIRASKSVIIAECGGFIYLHEKFEDNEGTLHSGAGLISGKAFKTNKLVRFGYIEIEALYDTVLLKKHQKIRSHEFHYFDSENNGSSAHAVKANKSNEWDCICAQENIFAGFPHLYLRGYEFIIQNLVDYLSERKSYV